MTSSAQPCQHFLDCAAQLRPAAPRAAQRAPPAAHYSCRAAAASCTPVYLDNPALRSAGERGALRPLIVNTWQGWLQPYMEMLIWPLNILCACVAQDLWGKPCIMRNVAHRALLQLVRNSGVHPHHSGSQLSSLSMILARAPPPLAAEKPGPEHVNELF